MYDSVRLEKGMYHLANRSFTQALEAADPSAQYAGTELAQLDAFERQLKRFDIHVSGDNCDLVEKFFTTTESAVLFPEFVRRAIKRGMNESILPELTAATSSVNASSCKGFSIDETDGAYSLTTTEGTVFHKTEITESAVISLDKYGRLISASYEALRQKRIDVLAVMLRAIGHKLAGAMAGKALDVIKNSVTPVSAAGSSIAYTDLATLYAQFTDFDLNTVIASPATVANILAMTEMRDRTLDAKGQVHLPFGAKLLKDASLDNQTVIGISRDYALACMTGSDVILESDRLIDCQLDRIAISIHIGFQPLMPGAAAVLNIAS